MSRLPTLCLTAQLTTSYPQIPAFGLNAVAKKDISR